MGLDNFDNNIVKKFDGRLLHNLVNNDLCPLKIF